MAFKLDISGHTSTQMMTALLYKRISDMLTSKGKKDLFSFVKSIKIRGANLSIKTEKPIVNSELQMFKSEIEAIFIAVSQNFGIAITETKITFR